MPSRNTIRIDTPASYYHVYGRGVNKQDIFLDKADKEYFLYLISRHLSSAAKNSKAGYEYPHYRGEIELLCYCLMNNHFHMLIYQQTQGYMGHFMKSILAAYVAYFNRRYGRRGPLLESRYLASLIDADEYLLHVSRYIHLNPRRWKTYSFSSLSDIRNRTEPEWLQTEKILNLHKSRESYFKFVEDYEPTDKQNKAIKKQLADQS